MINYYSFEHNFILESGATLENSVVAYSVYGNADAEKTIWVCHALSGNSLVPEWWGGLFGENKFFDFNEYRVICANMIGSCYGSTGPSDEEAKTYPIITIKDVVKSLDALRNHLQIAQIDILIGASLGGQQALEWAILSPNKIKQLILIATNAVHSPFGRAFNESQRLALLADQSFGHTNGGREGLKAARAIAMLSYRSYSDFEIKQSETTVELKDFKAASYVRYQGEKFCQRFSPAAYFTLSKTMDSHDVGRGKESASAALSIIQAKTLVIGVDSDLLFPLKEQEYLAKHIPNASLGVIKSPYGHDAFLIEYEQLKKLLDDFINNDFNANKPTTFKSIKH